MTPRLSWGRLLGVVFVIVALGIILLGAPSTTPDSGSPDADGMDSGSGAAGGVTSEATRAAQVSDTPGPRLKLDRSEIDFGTVAHADEVVTMLEFSNVGSEVLEIYDIDSA